MQLNLKVKMKMKIKLNKSILVLLLVQSIIFSKNYFIYATAESEDEVSLLRFDGNKIHLHKNIPHGSGLGGGSSNATFMLVLLNSLFNLKLSHFDLLKYAKKLGSDCSFFLYNKPSYVSGLGEKISSIQLDLSGLYIVVVKPNISCSTKEVFSKFKINSTSNPLDFSEKIELSINKHMNDLEAITFSLYPELKDIKTYLISLGAVYASMSGSGSSIFGLFKTKPIVKDINAWIWIKKL